jgi:CubicO group peptidase (beta-lactamase class C family)
MKKAVLAILIILIISAGIMFLVYPFLPRALYYNFAGIEDYKIFENRVVDKGSPIPWPVKLSGQKLPDSLRQQMEDLETIGFLVIQNDTIRYEEYWEDYGSLSLSNSFSMAKTFVGILIGNAIEEGKIKDIDQKVGDFLPEFNQGPNAGLTLRHLLTMSSCLNWDESYGSPISVTTEAYYGKDLPEVVESMEVVCEPGEVFNYQSGNTLILSFVLEKATGKSLSEYMAEKLWQPMGATEPALWSLDRDNGHEKAYCCFNSNLRDFARFGELILEQGNFAGRNLVPQEYMKELGAPADYLVDENGEPVDFYGLHTWIAEFQGMKIIYARGILGQYIITVPEKNIVIVRLGRQRSEKKINHHPSDLFLYLQAAMMVK